MHKVCVVRATVVCQAVPHRNAAEGNTTVR